MHDEAPAKPRAKGSGCLRALGIGCAVVAVLVLAGAIVVWLNRDAIRASDWYRSLSDKAASTQVEMGRMLALRGRLLADYPAEEVEVHTSTMAVVGKGRTHSLDLRFVNPRFPLAGDDTDRDTAREIALVAVSSYPEIERFDSLRVIFVSKRGAGITVSHTTPFSFPTAELLAEPERGDEEPAPVD